MDQEPFGDACLSLEIEMSRKFFEALRGYEEMLTYMSGMAHATKRESWQGAPEAERARCVRALEELTESWDNDQQQELVALLKLTQRCLDQYAQGELDAGDFTVKDIQELLAKLRDKLAAD